MARFGVFEQSTIVDIVIKTLVYGKQEYWMSCFNGHHCLCGGIDGLVMKMIANITIRSYNSLGFSLLLWAMWLILLNNESLFVHCCFFLYIL